MYPPMSGRSFGFVNNVTAPHTGKRRKMKLSQKAGRISVPYLPAKKKGRRPAVGIQPHVETPWTVKPNQDFHLKRKKKAPPVTIPAMNTLMLAHREPAQNKPRLRYAFLRQGATEINLELHP